MVQLERDGYLDDPTYIENLKKDHPLRVRENVFAFSMACASLQMLQMLALSIDPLGRSNPGEQLYHFVGGRMEPPGLSLCHPECLFPTFLARGDHCRFVVTGNRPPQLRVDSDMPNHRAPFLRRALATVSRAFKSLTLRWQIETHRRR